jgi:hypothetical protein
LHGLPGGAMTAPDQVQRYRIVARGESLLLAGVAGGLQIEFGRGWTSVVASAGDESELWGLLTGSMISRFTSSASASSAQR